MKKALILFCLALLFSGVRSQVAINTNGDGPVASAMLEVTSTDKGMLIPRMTTIQRTAISSPATALLVFDITTASFWFYDGSSWSDLSSGTPTIIADADDDTKVQVEKNSDDEMIRFDLGGTASFIMQNDAFSGFNAKFIVQNNGYSLFIGQEAGPTSSQGNYYNNYIGYRAGKSNTTGKYNTALGNNALKDNTTGSHNTGIGLALQNNTTGGYNSALGSNSLISNTTASNNTAAGYQALALTTTGSNNTAVGQNASAYNTTAHSNIAIGTNSLFKNADKSNLVAIGDSALYNNGTGSTQAWHGTENTAVGSKVLFSNTTGRSNSSLGYQSLYSNTTGDYNTAVGKTSLFANTTGNYNTAFGHSSLQENTEGDYNTALGIYALNKNTTGSENTAAGMWALYKNTTGIYNVGLGYEANYYNETGSNNTIIGYKAGRNTSVINSTDKSGNIFLGYKAGYFETGSNKLYVENSDADSTSALIYGEFNNNYLAINGKTYIKDSLRIGTTKTATGYILSIGGKVACEEVRVALQADWPDYVFSSDYKLLSINELDKFVKTNHHLPNIPPAKDIENSGLEMGEMQRKMIEKIEELSLYIISLQKQIEELKINHK